MTAAGLVAGFRVVLAARWSIAVFALAAIAFLAVFTFAWNLILFPSMYVRTDLWTLANILFLLVSSALSGLLVSMLIFNIRLKLAKKRGSKLGVLAILPSIFVSACPTCAPLILSFAAGTYGIGMMLSENGALVRLAAVLILSVTALYMSSAMGKCKIQEQKGIWPGK